GSADDVGQAVGEAGAGGKDARLVVEAVALADGGPDGDSGEVERPVYAVGHPGAVLPAVVAGEAIEREEVRILEVDRAGILVGDGEILARRRCDELEARGEALDAAHEIADQRPANLGRDRADRAAVPALGAAVDGGGGQVRVAGVVEVAAGIAGEQKLLAPAGDRASLPLGGGEGALGVLARGAKDREAVRLELDPAAPEGVGKPPAGVDGGERDRLLAVEVGGAEALEGPAGDRDV